MTKPETIAQLRRKIERLEAQVLKLTESQKVAYGHYCEYLRSDCDLRFRIAQAMRILSGEDEP